MLNRLTEINLTASDPDDWASDYVRVQFNDGALRVGPETSGRIAEFSEHEAD
jgi:hypothetical protein